MSPAAYFKIEDEEADSPVAVPVDEEELKEKLPLPAYTLLDAGAWRHHERALSRLGRVTAVPEELDDDGEPLVADASRVPLTPPLAALDPAAWTFRACPSCSGASQHSAIVAKSSEWPGALAVAGPNKFVCVYFGNGVAYRGTRFLPQVPRGAQTPDDMDAFLEGDDPLVDPTPPPPPEPEEEEEQEGSQGDGGDD